MRELHNKDELNEIKNAERGYILNQRTNVNRLHRVTCDYVAVMWINPHPKFFFAEFEEAEQWADARYGKSPTGWVKCNICHPSGPVKWPD